MPKLLQYAGQAVFFAAIAAFTGYFASRPVYWQMPPDMAQIKLSFAHGAARAVECKRLTSKEIAALPPNERRPNTCARERVAVHVQLTIDGEPIHDAVLEPTGLSRDGPARIYEKFLVPAGRHTITARLRDSRSSEGFNLSLIHISEPTRLQ